MQASFVSQNKIFLEESVACVECRDDSLQNHLDTHFAGKSADFLARAVVWASKNGYLELVRYLVEKGANFEAFDNEAVREASRHG